jgi:signal transduction histidine kinase
MNRFCFPEKCPESARIAVRFAQELLSGISRNQCPLYARIAVRNGQESVSGLVKNIHNASEAVFENGEILMKTSNPDEDKIKLEIRDNGVGIDPQDISHIFEPFFSAKEKERGIGLGLAIVHGIVQSHNGKIEVDSKVGKGTTISMVLPLIKNQKE